MSKQFEKIKNLIEKRETARLGGGEKAIEKQYYGDLVKNTSRFTVSDSTNDDITISNNISIVADQYACHNYMHMRYVVFMNSKWKISNAELAYPRIILTLGGQYHE